MKDNISKSPMFDPKSSFFELSIVRITAYVILFLILVSCGIILLCSNPTWDPSYEGFNHFFTIFKFPLYGLGFLASLLALYATNHRSEQNRAGMALAKAQNEFNNYYKHLEEFSKYVEKINPEKDSHDNVILDIDARKLHGFLFSEARHESYELDAELVEKFEGSFNCFLEVIKDFSSMSENDNPHDNLYDAVKCRDELGELFNGLIVGVMPNYVADFEYNTIINVPDRRENIMIPKSLRIFFTDTLKIYKQIYSVMAFDTKYDPNNRQKNKIFGLCDQFLGMKFEFTLTTVNLDEAKYRISNYDLKSFKERLSHFFEDSFPYTT